MRNQNSNKKIYLVDIIGNHSGMHYYLDAFKTSIDEFSDLDVEILSNYSTENKKKPFFRNIFVVNKLLGLCFLLSALIKYLIFLSKNKNSYIIWLFYGSYIDILFNIFTLKNQRIFLDIHEVIVQNKEDSVLLRYLLRNLYSRMDRLIIIHSSRSEKLLKDFRYNGKMIYVPHFKYCFKKEYNLKSVNDDVRNSISKENINVLFFGNLTYEKGVDILVQAANSLDINVQNKIRIIIAGKNFDDTIVKCKIDNSNVTSIVRHINDDEMIFLYKNVDYIILPYRKTSQSGILEMAFYFKKPIIASNILYFKDMLEKYPSLGMLVNNDIESLKLLFESLPKNNYLQYFNDKDYNNFINKDIYSKFVRELSEYILKHHN